MENDDGNEATKQVEAFITILQRRYGLSERDLDDVIRQLVLLKERTDRYKSYGEFMAKATIGLAIGAFFTALGWGIIHFIKDVIGRQ